MIQCSFEEEIILPNGGYQFSKCINKAEILVPNDPCYGLYFHCAYKKLLKEKELKKIEEGVTK